MEDREVYVGKVPDGYLRKPQGKGFIAPLAANSVLTVVEATRGVEDATRLAQEAELFRAPADDEPLREDKAARLHGTALRLWPDEGGAILHQSGVEAADALMQTQLSTRARTMLNAAPWTVGAWLLGRWAGQHSWTFAGSGEFSVRSEMEFEIRGNPLNRRSLDREGPASFWQEALFERMFQRLVDPRLICREMGCEANGDEACRFAFMLRDS